MTRKARSHRQELIQTILDRGKVQTQSELQKELTKKRIKVSVATICRDLKELGYIRAPIGDGSYRIIKVQGGKEPVDLLMRVSLLDLFNVGNMVIVKTRPGNGQAVAGALDRSQVPGILGTVAGDDTIFAITRTPSSARKAVATLKRLME